MCLDYVRLVSPCDTNLLQLSFSSRLDIDQSARRNAQDYFNVQDPDYYEFEGKYGLRLFIRLD